MRFIEIIYKLFYNFVDWFKQREDVNVFIGAVIILIALRLFGYASLSVFVALVYIMWFVSAGRR